jgi:hypothetical protein
MKVSDQIKRMRTMTRDPEGDVWSNQFYIDTFNDVQNEIQVKTGYLQNVAIVEIPPEAHFSYMHDWEWQYIPQAYKDGAYRCFRYSEQGGIAYTSQFEAEILNRGTGENSESGMAYTHPWEAFMEAPNIPARLRFPSDFHSMLYIAYDREPIFYSELSPIQQSDQSYVNNPGRPISYYRVDNLDSEFVLYPMPTVTWPSDEYLVFEDVEVVSDGSEGEGVITAYQGSLLGAETGFDIEVIDDQDNVFMVYKAKPTTIEDQEDESDFPVFLRKYIEYGVNEQCFMANTDGQIASLADYWRFRYAHGINVIKRFMAKRKQDRIYQMRPQVPIQRNQRHPRLPSNYPAN